MYTHAMVKQSTSRRFHYGEDQTFPPPSRYMAWTECGGAAASSTVTCETLSAANSSPWTRSLLRRPSEESHRHWRGLRFHTLARDKHRLDRHQCESHRTWPSQAEDDEASQIYRESIIRQSHRSIVQHLRCFSDRSRRQSNRSERIDFGIQRSCSTQVTFFLTRYSLVPLIRPTDAFYSCDCRIELWFLYIVLFVVYAKQQIN